MDRAGAGVTGDAQKILQKGLTRKDSSGKDSVESEAEKDILKLKIGSGRRNSFKNLKSSLKDMRKTTALKSDLSDDEQEILNFVGKLPYHTPDKFSKSSNGT